MPLFLEVVAVLARIIAVLAAFILLVFTLRRALFAFTILLGKRDPQAQDNSNDAFTPTVLVLAPCRNEAGMIDSLSAALSQLDYPSDRLRIVLIDDGSTDGTASAMAGAAQGRPNWHVLSLPRNAGKAHALNTALKQHTFGEIVYVFDADHRPQPDALMRAMRYFQDERVGGVSGRTVAMNALSSPSAYYSAVEGDVHQMVTMRAKDRLNLAPALLGSNCGYRRAALAACGGFPGGALLEDSVLTLALACAGYQLRFAPDAVAGHQVPQTLRGYLRQHIRWARGFNDVAGARAPSLFGACAVSWPARIELLLFSAGYLDRLALLAGLSLLVLSAFAPSVFWFPSALIILSLVMPLVQIMLLFIKQRSSAAWWIRLPLVPLFFAVDIFAALRGMVETFARRASGWTPTERVAMPDVTAKSDNGRSDAREAQR
jgi:cellulose synthase/poly-beta-1,6-N-acetylglucosamine synthase-like glycosyltransferase